MNTTSKKVQVAVIGATGTVGQKVIALLNNHPRFEVSEVVASERSTGKLYGERVTWREKARLNDQIKNLKLISYKDIQSDYVISSIPADDALIIEKFLAEKGKYVISNTRSFRMDEDVPLVIPEINPDHLALMEKQSTTGKIITNPNCSTIFLAMALGPIFKSKKVKHVDVVTLQALSGAGHPGVSSNDILGNIIPNIGGEEEKIESEILKILGSRERAANFSVMAHCHRVPVLHGHTIAMHVHFEESVTPEEFTQMFQSLEKEYPQSYCFHSDQFRPQPRLDLDDSDNRTHIGRVKQTGNQNVIGLISLGHNLVKGAAGAAISNLELLLEYLEN